MQITMIGHSTVLIEIAGLRILTDPFFGEGNLAYRRLCAPARTREELRDVDLVLLSHHHFDHVDGRFLRLLGARPVIAPQLATWITHLHGARHVVGLRPWQEWPLGGLHITAMAALHLDLSAGYIIAGEGRQVYFAGDTYYDGFMAEIGRRFPLDVALLPVTTFRLPMTMGEAQAMRATRDLQPKVVIPIHLGVQPRLPLLRTGQTPEGFARRVHEAGLPTQVIILHEGQSWTPTA